MLDIILWFAAALFFIEGYFFVFTKIFNKKLDFVDSLAITVLSTLIGISTLAVIYAIYVEFIKIDISGFIQNVFNCAYIGFGALIILVILFGIVHLNKIIANNLINGDKK